MGKEARSWRAGVCRGSVALCACSGWFLEILGGGQSLEPQFKEGRMWLRVSVVQGRLN